MIKSIVEQGIDVIGMVKAKRYLVGQKRVGLKELYRLATPASGNKGIFMLYSYNYGERRTSKGCICSKS